MINRKQIFEKALSFALAISLILSVFSTLGLVSASDETPVPAIQNEGFENGDNKFTGSSAFFSQYQATGAEDTNVHSGSHSLKNLGTSGNNTWYLNNALKVESGKSYALSFWYKGGSTSATSVSLSIFQDQTNNEFLNGSDDWKFYSKIFTASDANTDKHFGIMVYKQIGEMFFDDIKVEEVSSSYYVEDFEDGNGSYNASQVTVGFETEDSNTYLKAIGGGNTNLNLPIYLDSTKKYTVSFRYKSNAWFCWYNGGTQYGLDSAEWATVNKTGITGQDAYIKFYIGNGKTFCLDDLSIKEELTASAESVVGGTVNISDSSPLYGDNVTYSVEENEGFTFKEWQNGAGETVSTSATYTFPITESTVLTPVFEAVEAYIMTALSSDSTKGTATVSKAIAFEGETITYTASANDGYEFSAWLDASGNTVSVLNPYRVVANATTELTAKFGNAEKGVQKEGFENNPSMNGPYNGGSGKHGIYHSYDENGNVNYVKSGYSSLLISRVTGNYGVRVNGISFESGKTYSVSFKYRNTDDATGAWFYILGNGNYSANASTEWQTYSKQITFDTNISYFEISTNSSSGLLIDDILVKEINIYNQSQGFEFADASINILDPGKGLSNIYTPDSDNYSSNNVFSGANSLKVSHDAVEGGNLRTRINGYTITAGKTYNLTFKYKITAGESVWFYAIDPGILPISQPVSDEWYTATVDYTPSSNASSIEIGTTTKGAVIYFDDVVLRQKADFAVNVNKESARIDYINASADKIFVSDILGFTVKKTNSNDNVSVLVNSTVATPDENGVYTVEIAEKLVIDITVTGEYSDALPNAGRGLNGEILDCYDAEIAMKEFWYGDTVYHEAAFFYDCFDDISGEQVTRNEVSLLYPVSSVVSIRSYDMKKYYVLGVDYNIVEGKIVLTENSSIPVYTEKLTALRSVKDAQTDNSVASGDSSYADFYYIDDTYGLRLINSDKSHNDHTVLITYTHNNTWSDVGETGYIPKTVKPQGTELNNLYAKLNGTSTEDINVLVYGDSCATGATSSGTNMSYVLFDEAGNASTSAGRAPYAPAYFEQAVNALVDEYGNGNNVNYYNIALGGKNANWGLLNLDKRLGYLNTYYQTLNSNPSWQVNPDLIIVQFSGNDYLTNLTDFNNSMSGIVSRFKELYPNADIVLTTDKLNNTACYMYTEEQAFAIQDEIIDVADRFDGVIYAQETDVFSSMIDSKLVVDYLSNNINHGNDFYARVYAQVMFNACERNVSGDTNSDGKVDILDLVRMKKCCAGISGVNMNIKTYDTDLNAKFDVCDLVYLRKILLGIVKQ